ncbi:MAG: insulinase family protein [Ruminococcus sp.]|nr:insulinase family protein [Ruminococcus sp.]
MSQTQRIRLADGVQFSAVRDSRFKTMKLSANIIVPLSAETASANALICGVLSRSCKAYPDFTALSKKLSSLYGADLNVSIRKSGDNQVLTLSASGLDDRYTLGGESVARELSQLLCGVIFEPNLKDNAFLEEEVEQERRQLLDLIDSEFNEKRIYANAQLVKYMCQNEVFGIKRYGTAEKIKEATPQSLYAAWQQLLKTAVFEILYIGDSAPDKAIEVFAEAFGRIDRAPVAAQTEVIRHADEPKHITEEMSVAQSKLVMGFRAGTALPDREIYATNLMCAILGGTANSKLFCNVREKQSLCYYCSSRYDKMKGILFIDSGVEGGNIEKLEAGVMHEIEDMQNGVITDFEIEATKMAIVNAYHTSNDTVSGIESWYMAQLFDGSFKSIEEMAAIINAVTKEEIVAAANRLTLDTVYVLKNR